MNCLLNEEMSEVIERYRKLSGDYEYKEFFLGCISINQGDRRWVSQFRIQNNPIITVYEPKQVIGGGCGAMFCDLSKNKAKEIGFVPNAPSYRRVRRGINIFGICNCRTCIANGKEVAVIINDSKFDLISQRNKLFCPKCHSFIEPKAVGFYLYKYQISGKKIENDRNVPFRIPPDEATNKNGLKYFVPDLNGEVMMTELKIKVLEYL